MALLRFVCVPCIVFLNAIVFNFNQSHMDITELLWSADVGFHISLSSYTSLIALHVCESLVIVKNILL